MKWSQKFGGVFRVTIEQNTKSHTKDELDPHLLSPKVYLNFLKNRNKYRNFNLFAIMSMYYCY